MPFVTQTDTHQSPACDHVDVGQSRKCGVKRHFVCLVNPLLRDVDSVGGNRCVSSSDRFHDLRRLPTVAKLLKHVRASLRLTR